VVVQDNNANVRGQTRTNHAVVSWTGPHSLTAVTTTVTIVEPTLTIAKSVSPDHGDASDPFTYTITITNASITNGNDALDVHWSDALPSGLTYVPGSLHVTSGTAFTSKDDTSSLPNLTADWDSIALNSTTILTYQATLKVDVPSGAVYTNITNLTWTSLTADNDPNERTGADGVGGALNNYAATSSATVTVTQPAPLKSLVTTSEPGISGVAIGEVARFRVVVTIPEGTTPDVTLVDAIPPGLTFLNDGSAKIAFVSNGGLTSDSIPGATALGDETYTGHPTVAIPGGNITGGPFADDTDPTFHLGSLTNLDSDLNLEEAVIEFNAIVSNVPSNNTPGTSLSDAVSMYKSGSFLATSNAQAVTVSHPSITLTKQITTTPHDGGDQIVYLITVHNAGGANISPAYDLRVQDTLDANLGIADISKIAVVGPGAHNNSDPSNRIVDVTFDSLLPGAADDTITITATVSGTVDAARAIPNTATATWTSIPGPNGTVGGSNTTGSNAPGNPGDANGERTGSGVSPNNYTDSKSANTTLDGPSISKLGPTPAGASVGGSTTFDVVVTLPEGTTRGLTVVDTLPAGLIPVGSSVVTTHAGSNSRLPNDFNGTVSTTPDESKPDANGLGGAWTLTFGDTITSADNDATNNSFLVRFTAVVANVTGNRTNVHLINHASLQYTESGTQTVAAPESPFVNVLEPKIQVTKTANVSSPGFGAIVTYTLTLSHDGTSNSTAYDVSLTDTLPAGLTYVPGSLNRTAGPVPTSAGEAGGTITITFGSFPLATTSTFTYQATVGSAPPVGTVNLKDTLTNNARATWTSLAGSDPNERTGADGVGAGLNNYAAATTAPVVVSGIDLIITNDDGQTQATAGVTRVYALGYQNVGNTTATGSTITETVPVGTTFKSAGSTAGWDCADGSVAGTVCHNLAGTGSVAASASGSVNFAVTVVDPIAGGQSTIVNIATIADDHATNVDPTPDNNTATDTDTIPMADLSLIKGVDVANPGINQVVTFTLTLHNGGPAQATNVTVVDVIPAALTYVRSTPSPGTYVPGTGLWTVGTLDNGATVTLQIQAQVTTTTAVINTAEVTHSDQGDPNSTPGNGVQSEDDWAHAAVNPTVSDIGVSKAIDNPTPDVGSDVTFTIVAHNYGPDNATGVKVTDTLPAGLTFGSATPSAGWAAGTWTVGDLNNGASETLTLVAHVVNPGAITNTATVTSDDFDTNLANNTASTGLAQLVDVTVAKAVDNPTPNVGTIATFTLTIGNLGPSTAHNVVIHDVAPAGLTVTSITLAQGTYDPGTGNWSVGTIAPNASVTAIMTARVVGSAPMTNTASVVSLDEVQSSTANDTASVTVTPPQADLAINKTVDEPRPNVGDADTFTLTVTNHGPDAATNVVATDVLPAGLSIDPAKVPVAGQGSFDASGGIWSIGPMAKDAVVTLTLHAIVDVANDYTNTATVTADQYDPNPDNNSASAFLTTRVADIAVTKLADRPAPTVGTTVTYTVTATNLGPDPASFLVIHDPLPTGLTYVSNTPGAGTYDATSGDWTIGGLAVETTVSLDITARVVGSGTIDNTAAVSGLLQRDPVKANDSAKATIDVPPAADLALTKTVDAATPDEGTNVTFTVTVTNYGPNATSGVHVQDLLPAGLTFVSDTTTLGNYDSASGDWTIGDMAVGDVQTMKVTATVAVEGPITNTAEVSASSLPDPNSVPGNGAPGENDQASAGLNSHGVADLSLTKVVSVAAVHKGDQTTYTLVVTNNGPDGATGVIVRDQLPAAVTFVGSSGPAYDPTTGAWTVGNLSSGSSATITITVLVGQTGSIVNTADVVASDQRDPDPTNGEASVGVSATGATPPPTLTQGPADVPSAPGSLALWVLGLAVAGLTLIAFGSFGARSRHLKRRM
jgi:uncharacterized repeat protein (TIGR01451 family)/fimbrial isopeptide formation D2 family protein